VPANDDVRRLMKHPRGSGFPASGGAEWPLDRFTKRRLVDGSITREEAKSDEKERREPERRQRRSDEPNNAA
jgi:hypothetical protein